ncbi:MAG: adenylate/guanylate cyclase domain-containing protein [Pseudomonadota bacterium]
MDTPRDNSNALMVLQDLRLIHARRVRLILLTCCWVLLLIGTGWGLFFVWHANLLLVALDAVLVGTALFSMYLVRAGLMVRATLLLNAILFLFFVGLSLFLDVPSAAVPRSTQLFLIPLAIASSLLLKNERTILRHGLPLLSLLAAVVLCSSNVGVATSFKLPDDVRLVGGWVNSLMAMGTLYALVAIFFGDIHRMENYLQGANNRFVGLVSGMFPKSIAERLLATGKTFAERHTNCSILFADIVGFTPMAAKLTPEKLVAVLSEIFDRFDQCVEEFGLTKIKTIGDAYMVASGVPHTDARHASNLLEFAMKLLHVIKDFDGVTLRIGISSGDVVAGVIGQSRQVYDVWGNVVNMASRMESHGISGRIQVSQETFDKVRDDFVFEERAGVAIKGLDGLHRVYLLKGRITGRSDSLRVAIA